MGKDPISVRFDNDGKSLIVIYEDRLEVYSCDRVLDTIGLKAQKFDHGEKNLELIERLGDTNFHILASSNRKRMWMINLNEQRVISTKDFLKRIVSLKVNNERLIVCTEDYINIYNTHQDQILHRLDFNDEISSNARGILDFSVKSLLAFPMDSKVGEVILYDAMLLETAERFRAHESGVAIVKFNASGDLIATASVRGTIIRVFVVQKPNGPIYEFRRGTTSATIGSLCFSADSQFLCSSSDTRTVHVFKLEALSQKINDVAKRKSSAVATWFDTITSLVSGTVPKTVTDCLTVPRCFASLSVPGTSTKIVTAMIRINYVDLVLVATSDAVLYAYMLKPDDVSNLLTLVRQFRIDRPECPDPMAVEATRRDHVFTNIASDESLSTSPCGSEQGAGEIADFSEIADQDNKFRAAEERESEEEEEHRKSEDSSGNEEDEDSRVVPRRIGGEEGRDAEAGNWVSIRDDQFDVRSLDDKLFENFL